MNNSIEKDNNIRTSIKKRFVEGMDIVNVTKGAFKKYYINAKFKNYDEPCPTFQSLQEFLTEEKATIVTQDFFGSCSLYNGCMNALSEEFGKIDWPVTWIEGYGLKNAQLTGSQIYAVSGVSVKPIIIDEKIIGNIFENEDAKFCFLGNVLPDNISLSNLEQTKSVFEKMEMALQMEGMDFSNVVRTWLYINDILGWYDEFNEVRTKFFNERNIFDGIVPASTGIGVANPSGAAMVAELLAIKSKSNNVSIKAIASPLQCPAIDYNSSFSRAVEVNFSDHRRLYISGTASIDPDGNTIHVGDLEKQIDHTMEVVNAILKSRQMNWDNTSRAIAYFPDLTNAKLMNEYRINHGINGIPMAIAHGDICRNDLLFEIEVDAIKNL